MTHTLHEQSKLMNSGNDVRTFFVEELGLTDEDSKLTISDGQPYIGVNSTYYQQYTAGGKYIEQFMYARQGITMYWHISDDLSVRYAVSDEDSSSVMPIIFAQDINGEWSFITKVGCACGSGSNIVYTRNALVGSDGTLLKYVNQNNICTVTKFARPDNGVPFKSLYMVTSAQFYTKRDTLVTLNDGIYRLVHMTDNSYDSVGPIFAFKVSD